MHLHSNPADEKDPSPEAKGDGNEKASKKAGSETEKSTPPPPKPKKEEKSKKLKPKDPTKPKPKKEEKKEEKKEDKSVKEAEKDKKDVHKVQFHSTSHEEAESQAPSHYELLHQDAHIRSPQHYEPVTAQHLPHIDHKRVLSHSEQPHERETMYEQMMHDDEFM